MPRKKKKDNTIDQRNITTTIKNGTNLGGNVKVTFLKNGKVIGRVDKHNTGTVNLCDYIAHALTGEYIAANRPGVIIPFYGSLENPTLIGNGTPYSESKVTMSASDWGSRADGGYCATTLSFLIPSSIVSGQTLMGFVLLSKDASRKVDAAVQISDEGISITGDTSLKVEWTIYVSYRFDIDI